MKHLLLSFLALFLFVGIIQAQDKPEKIIKKEKKIILKIADEDGKIVTKVIEEGGDEAIIEAENIWITERGDSIDIEVEIEEGEDGMKKIKKRIVIPEIEGLEDLKELEELRNIEIFEFEGDGMEGPHIFHFREGDFPHPRGEEFFVHREFAGMEKKAKLGVYIEDHEKGVKVKEVIENSSAYSVGILAGDVIYEINDKKMTNMEELVREVSSHKPGDFIDVELRRNGKKKKFNVRLQGESGINQFKVGSAFPHKMFKPHLNEMIESGKHHFFEFQEDCKHVAEECKHKAEECKKKAHEIEKEVQYEIKKQKEEIKKQRKTLKQNVKDKEKFMHKREMPLSEEDEN